MNQLLFAIVSGAQVCQAVYIAPWFALLTLSVSLKDRATNKEKDKKIKKTKRQYNADKNSNSLKSFQNSSKSALNHDKSIT